MTAKSLGLIVLLSLAAPLRAEWKLQWMRELPPRKAAWRFTERMPKDTAYEPVAQGPLVLIACMHNDALLALDAETGRERWRFCTNGPIRVAPLADASRIYVGCDDGHLYCLDHAGRCLWKVRGGPSQRRVIGHERLISAWPVGARCVLAGGKVFFAAGCWPIEGIFVHALDARTGERIWTNDKAMLRPFGRMAVSGDALYVYGHGGSVSLDAATGEARPEKPPRLQPAAPVPAPPGVKGSVELTVAAGDRLLVATREGRVYCFSERDARPGAPEPPPAGPKADTSPAGKVLAGSGVTQGLALVLGLKDGALVEGLLGRSKLHVIAIDPDARKVNSIRRRLDAKGLFDDYRLAVHVGEPESFGLPPYVAGLIVTETQQKCTDAIRQLLRPYGGTFAERSGDAWKLTRREGPLPGSADWTHEFADEGNLLCGRDKLVKAPLGVQWYGGAASDPRYYFNGNVGHDTRGDGVCPLPPNAEVVDGRMILQGPGILAAVDVYTGRVLWETPIPRMFVFGGKGGGVGIHSKSYREPWKVPEALEMEVPPSQHSRTSGLNYVSMPDGIYMVAGKRLLRYDPADGRLISDWPMPLKDAPCWGNIRVSGDWLIATAFSPKDVVDAKCGHDGNGGDWAKDRMKMSHLLVLDRRSGKLLWSRKAAWGFLNCGMAVGGGRVFCVDLIVENVLEKLREAGHTFPDTPPMLYGLDLRTGKEVWSYRTDALVKHLAYSAQRDILVAPCRNLMEWKEGSWVDTTKDTRRGKGGRNRPGRMRGFSGRDGTVLWEVDEAPYFEPHIIVHDLIIDRYAGTYDLRTGKRHERVSPLTGEPETWTFRRGGCNHLVAGENLVTWRTAYYDLAGMSGVVPLTGMDAGCTPTFIPGGGILTAGNFGIHYKRSCTTAMALVHRPDGEVWTSYVSQRSRDSSIGNGPIRRAGFNFAAPGDRRAKDGTLWLAVTARKAENVAIQPKEVQWFGVHPTRADSWVVASGVKGASEIAIPTVLWGGKRQPRSDGQVRPYAVRLHFAEPQPLEPGGRILNVSLEGKCVLRDFDIAKAAGGASKAVVREFKGVQVTGELDISLSAGKGRTLICGVEIVAE